MSCGGRSVKRLYEKNVKGYVYTIGGGPGHKMQLPKDERRGRACPPSRVWSVGFSLARRALRRRAPPRPSPRLTLRRPPPLSFPSLAVGLKQPYLVFQLMVPPGQHVSLEVGFSDQDGTRRRLQISSSFVDVKPSALHCQVPLPAALAPPGRWTNLVLHVPALAAVLFAAQGVECRAVESVAVGASCRLRKIFTLRAPPRESGTGPRRLARQGSKPHAPRRTHPPRVRFPPGGGTTNHGGGPRGPRGARGARRDGVGTMSYRDGVVETRVSRKPRGPGPVSSSGPRSTRSSRAILAGSNSIAHVGA